MRALGASRTSLVPGGVLAGPWVRDDLWRRARAVPSLDLRFATNKSLVDATTGQNLVTFTRASSGTFTNSAGVLQTAATDVPRFDHNPTTGESLGLLVEEQRTNSLLRSEEFDNAGWAKTQSSVSLNTATSPAGTLTADSLVENTASGFQHYTSQTVTISANTIHTTTLYVKANTRSSVRFGLLNNALSSGAFAHFNVSTGVISTQTTAGTASNVSFSIEAAASGWYRCRVTCTVDSSSTLGTVFIGLVDGTNNAVYTGDGTSGIFLWGAQLEAGAFPTSYIPTTTAAATRSADVCSITGSAFSGFYRQDEGTVFAECAVAQPNVGGNQFILRSSDNTFINSIAINIPGAAQLATTASSVFDGSASSVLALVANVPSKIAGAYASNNLGISLNGATAITDATATIPITQTRADIGSDHIGFNRVKAGTIRRLSFWPTRLANSTLQTLTQ